MIALRRLLEEGVAPTARRGIEPHELAGALGRVNGSPRSRGWSS